MVFAFFRSDSGDGSFDAIVARSASMLADARHSFDLASLVLLTDADAASVSADVHETDHRINVAEQELRSELVVHVSVQGSMDIGSVLGFTLLIKKIERIGDQAKNILELAEHGVSLAHADDIDAMLAERQTVSALFAEASELLAAPDPDVGAVEDFAARCDELTAAHKRVIEDCLDSDRPGREVVPLAIYYRYLRRIVANLLGVVRASIEPLPQLGHGSDRDDDED